VTLETIMQLDSDEDWETSDLNLPNLSVSLTKETGASSSCTDTCTKSGSEEGEPKWDVDLPTDRKKDSSALECNHNKLKEKEYVILILVDLTVLSGGKIHNKFDKFSVNDQDAKRALCDRISSSYNDYANNSKLIMDQTVRHCSELVWKEALESLRTQFKGHYWFPFFPPKDDADKQL
jgi:hypothetical protein